MKLTTSFNILRPNSYYKLGRYDVYKKLATKSHFNPGLKDGFTATGIKTVNNKTHSLAPTTSKQGFNRTQTSVCELKNSNLLCNLCSKVRNSKPSHCINHSRNYVTSKSVVSKRQFLKIGEKFTIAKRNVIDGSSCTGENENVGLVLGVYNEPGDVNNEAFEFTKTGEMYDKIVHGHLRESLKQSGPCLKMHEARCFYGLEPKFSAVAVVGLGESCQGYNDVEQQDDMKEDIRNAAALGSKILQTNNHVDHIYVESFGHAESAAEGAAMGVWVHQEHRKHEDRLIIPKLFLFDNCDITGWQIGLHKAAAQNLARQLTEMPPNQLTPRTFAEHAVKLLHVSGINLEMKIKHWLKMVGMDAFLALAKGSCEEPILLEATYYGCDPTVCPIVLIGKGVTFDSGGLCLKEQKFMKHMRGDMSGAAIVIATLRAASALQLPINIRALLPMCENMIGPRALKPGDTIKSLNDKTVRVEDTDTDGHLSIIDIISYAATYNPKFILDIGALSKSAMAGMGSAATPVFTNNDALWEQMRVAGVHTGDRVWRFPLWNHYTKSVQFSRTADLKDTRSKYGGLCNTAALLYQFVCGNIDWIHMDTYGVQKTQGKHYHYLRHGMTGRPTRTLIEFLAQFACQLPESKNLKCKTDGPKNLPCKFIKEQPCC